MDIHDGNVLKVGDLYHWYGMGYTNCTLETGLLPPRNCPGIYLEFGKHCGFRTDHKVNLYTSHGSSTKKPKSLHKIVIMLRKEMLLEQRQYKNDSG